MNKSVSESVRLAGELIESISTTHRVMIAPPFTALAAVSSVLEGSSIGLGAQNMASAESGAHTGEISPGMILDVGAESVILGHSERRAIYGEDDSVINTKVRLALSLGMEVILCVGETLQERESGNAETVVGRQLELSLDGVEPAQFGSLVIAYEPVWAIGTGATASPDDADEMHAFVRSRIGKSVATGVAESLIIQYGGSVKPENAASLLSRQNIDGALVGGASLDSESFAAIIGAV